MGGEGRIESLDLPAALASRYRPVHVLGRGAFGVVFRAHQVDLARSVVVKLVRLERAPDPVARERFLREARVLASLASPYVSPVLDFGIDGEGAYLVFPDDAGTTLGASARAQEGKLLPDDCARLFRQALEGLAVVHAGGVVHRDLKPENLLLTGSGELRIIDFGLATPEASRSLTETGAIVGTPSYMSPDQLNGKLADPRDDLYSLAVAFYELACGVNPFRGGSFDQMLERQLYFDPPPLATRAPGLAPGFCRALTAMLAKTREARPAGAREALALLDAPGPPGAGAGDRTASSLLPAAVRREPAPSGSYGPGPGSFGIRPASRVPIARAAAGLALVAAGWMWAGARRPVAPAEPDAPGAGPLARLEEALARTMVDLGPDPTSPRAPPDPAFWRDKVTAYQPVKEFFAWLDAGGRPEGLPLALRRDLEGLAPRLAARGLGNPFHPFLAVDPGPAGDFAAVETAALAAAEAASRRLDDEVLAVVDGRPWTSTPPDVVSILESAARFASRKTLREAGWQIPSRIIWAGGEARTILDRWLAGPGRLYERWVYAAGRAAAVPGEAGEAQALDFDRRLGKVRAAGVTAMFKHAPATLLGGAPRTPAGRLMVAELTRQLVGPAAQVAGLNSAALAREAVAALVDALAPPGPGPAARQRFLAAWRRLASSYLKQMRPGDLAAAVARAAPGLGALPAAEAREAIEFLRRRIAASEETQPGQLEELEGALGTLEGIPAAAGGRAG